MSTQGEVLLSYYVHLSPPRSWVGDGKYSVRLNEFHPEKTLDNERHIHGEPKWFDTYKEAKKYGEELVKQYKADFVDGKVKADMEPEKCQYTDRIICPYCMKPQGDDDYSECDTMMCNDCEEEFEINRDYTVHYSTKRIKPKEEEEEEDGS